MKLPPVLVTKVQEGRAVLFLGAGAAIGARVGLSGGPPDGDELRDRIAERFLPSHLRGEPLAWVAELAASTADLYEVQDFIAAQFEPLAPAAFHGLMPTFAWRGIATTNYDRLVELVYANARRRVQAAVPFLSDQDRVDHKLRDRSTVALLKLHGCITRTHDAALPLILSLDQYAAYRANRSRLFRMFEEWATENSVIFVGHRLQDPNLRGVLLELIKKFPSRPRYYLVRPGVNQVEVDFWGEKDVTVLDGTFEDFLVVLDGTLDRRVRGLASRIPAEHRVHRRWVVDGKPSEALLSLLNSEFELVDDAIGVGDARPIDFYRGAALGWFPILRGLDVRRRLTSQIMDDVILRPEEDRPSTVELYAIRAEAGAGKTVLLRRLAFDASTRAGALCLYFRGGAPESLEPLRELCDATGERLFLFIDNASQHLRFIRDVVRFARAKGLRISVVTAERTNEWNVNCGDLDDFLSDTHALRYLSREEIGALVDLLETHDSLGPHLKPKSREDRIREFEERAGRQLLVALHEATLGRPFEEILLDEFEQLTPDDAKKLYLTVCTLNRLKVPVRAGLISRIHGIPFEDFQLRLFKPLEHVVFVSELPWGDYAYRSRHSEIAQIVFDRVLEDADDRYNEYARVLKALNPLYSIDLSAIRDMIRAKWVHQLFPSYDDANAVYDVAFEVLARDSYLLQQRANYERIRPDGNLGFAEKLLHEARALDPRDSSVVHTLAEVLRAKAEAAGEPLERAKYRAEAGAVLRTLSAQGDSDRYAAVTRVKLAKDEVADLLTDESASDRKLDEALRGAERTFATVRQRYPGDQYILAVESEFAALLDDHERSLKALEAARRANPRDPFIASRLSSILMKRNEVEGAKSCLEEALDSNTGDKRLNFQYAEVLRKLGNDDATLAYYYRRAFSKWDENYESQFWYARYLYTSNDPKDGGEAREIFRHLRDVPMSHEERIKVRDLIGGDAEPREFRGAVLRMESTHGFVEADGRGDSLFMHQSDVAGTLWPELQSGMRVRFNIGFSLRGAKAVKVQSEAGDRE